MAEKTQLNLYVDRKLRNRLKQLADDFDFGSTVNVGADIIQTYVDHWERMQKRLRQVKNSEVAKLPETLPNYFGRTGTKPPPH